MYDQFYHLNAEPFRLSPDHAFAFAHKGYIKARAYMAYAFMREEGFVMVTGRPGTGKTTLVGTLIEHLSGENVRVANLVCSQLEADDLLKIVAYEFGVSLAVVDKGELLQRLTEQLRAWHRDGRRALLIVDEAQDLAVSAMEELRLLTNIQVSGKPLLQIFLLGQPELRDLVLRPELEQVHQRIVAASHLQPLAVEETQAYILHRLDVVGWRGDPAFSQAVFPLIFKFSEGIPRRINLICSRLLLHCALERRHRVEVADVREVIGELQDEHLAAGSALRESDFTGLDETLDVARDSAADEPSEPGPGGSAEVYREPPPAGSASRGPEPDGTAAPAGDSDAAVKDAAAPQSRVRQHLKVVSAAEPVMARRTGTDGEPLAEQPPRAPEVGFTAPLESVPPGVPSSAPIPASPPSRAAAAVPAKSPSASTPVPPAPPRAPHRQQPPVRPGPEGTSNPREGSSAWVVGVLFVLSVALVAWAASGFSLVFLL
ncbi:MAG: AAA family ATPase [Haliea sp.]|uniref:AAA family ATPase n=1 Tax=Haliea sp. TaxID=1932666 RepID=UPI0032EED71B